MSKSKQSFVSPAFPKCTAHLGRVNSGGCSQAITYLLIATLTVFFQGKVMSQTETAPQEAFRALIEKNIKSYKQKTANLDNEEGKHSIVGSYDGDHTKKIEVEIVNALVSHSALNFTFYYDNEKLVMVTSKYQDTEHKYYFKGGKLVKVWGNYEGFELTPAALLSKEESLVKKASKYQEILKKEGKGN